MDRSFLPMTSSLKARPRSATTVVRIELEKPIPNYWVNWSVGYWPMPKHIFGEMPLDQLFAEPYATMPIGNGAFKATKFVDGQYMEMEANPDFFAGKPHVDKFIVRFGDPTR